jgi:hypothetical protein
MEIAPLGEALALAQAAEDFISGTAARTGDRAAHKEIRATIFRPGPKPEETQQSLTALAIDARQMAGAEALAGLSSLVAFDDMIDYLRQRGEVFAEDESPDELLVRANLKRAAQGLPPFALLPGTRSKAATRDKPSRAERIARPRPPTGRERAEWARRVVDLAAD